MSKRYVKNQQTKKYEKPKKNDLNFYVLAAAAFNLLLSLKRLVGSSPTGGGEGVDYSRPIDQVRSSSNDS